MHQANGSFKNYLHDATGVHGPVSTWIIDIEWLPNGKLLLTTGNGAQIMDTATGIFKLLPVSEKIGGKELRSNQNIGRILKDSKGRIWTSVEAGLLRVDEKAGKMYLYPQGENVSITQLHENSKGKLMVSTCCLLYTSPSPRD